MDKRFGFLGLSLLFLEMLVFLILLRFGVAEWWFYAIWMASVISFNGVMAE